MSDLLIPVTDVIPDIMATTTATVIPCTATGATVTMEFNAAVAEASVADGLGTAVIGGGADGGSTVTFELSDTPEATPTEFSVVLEFCDEVAGDEIVASVAYSDVEGNQPDLSALQGGWATVPACGTRGGGRRAEGCP